MSNSFKCGTATIPLGATDLAVTGISLSFTPKAVLVSVRQPTVAADLISAYLVGAATSTGFNVTFSAAPASADYTLEWAAFAEEGASPETEGSLAADYLTLKKTVAQFLGYDETALTAREISEVDGIIQSGVRRFYYPPAMNGVDPNFEWSFLRQAGSVQTTAGTSDYLLPDGFGRIAGQINFSGTNQREMSVPVIPYGDVRRMLANDTQRSKPKFAAIASVKDTYGNKGQRKRLYLYPCPDAAYTLNFDCDADTGKLDSAARQFPLGGPMFAELVIESCLAVAEQRSNDESGLHTQNFNELLVSMIQRDRKSGAQNFGRMGSRMW